MTPAIERFISKLLTHLRVRFSDLEMLHDYSTRRGYHFCYVTRRSNYLFSWLIRRLCQNQGLPSIQLSLGQVIPTTDAEQIALRPRSFIVLPRWTVREHRERLMERLESLPERTILIPIGIFAGKGPKPIPLLNERLSIFPFGELWSLAVFLLYRKESEIDIGHPVLLSPNRREDLNRLARELYKQEKAHRGASEHTEDQIERIVLSGQEYEELLSHLSESEHLSYLELSEQASTLLHRIRGKTSGVVILLMRWFLVPIFQRIFTGIHIEGIDRARDAMREHPLLLLPNHRSHFDYLLLSYVLYTEHLPLPYIAAGENLNFFPMGFFLRRAGAFFIRRRSQRDPLYKFVLERYITYLLKQGHLIEFFIEGGRSRSGLALHPRVGLLKYVVQAIHAGERKDAVIMPVAVTYEKVPEEQSLARELIGERKRRESLFGLLNARRILRARFGSVSVRFGDAHSARDLEVVDLHSTALGFVRAQSDLADITPLSLISAAQTLLPKGASREELKAAMLRLAVALFERHGLRGLSEKSMWGTFVVPAGLKLNVGIVWCLAGTTLGAGIDAVIDYVHEHYPGFPANDATCEYYKNQFLNTILSDAVSTLIHRMPQAANASLLEIFETISPIVSREGAETPGIFLQFLREPIEVAFQTLQVPFQEDEDPGRAEILEFFSENGDPHTAFTHYAELALALFGRWKRLDEPTRAQIRSELALVLDVLNLERSSLSLVSTAEQQ